LTDYSNYLKYLPWATDRQELIVNTVIEHKSREAASKVLGCSESNVANVLHNLKNKALDKGYSEKHGITDRHVYATSTLRRGEKDDDFALQWIKTRTPQEQKVERVLNILESHEYKPAPEVTLLAEHVNDSLATLYTLTDYHLGMYSWSQETGDDWDTAIAQKVMTNAISDMVNKSPNSKLGILNIQGDFLHWDGLDAVTPMSGHVLDADTRFDRMIELAIDLNIWAIEKLLTNHEQVQVVICEGNHDMAGSAWLRKCLKKIMAKNPRVSVDDTSIPYYALLHGEIMLGFHHGHKKKNSALPMLFSSEPKYRKMWGKATYTYIHTGHYHHTEQDMSESGGAIVERHPTLAGRDAYAARGGYVSRRGARAITYDKKLGEVERITVLPRES
jgi:hypothetical protein